MGIPTDRSRPVAGREFQRHQRAVGGFVGRFFLRQPLPLSARAQQLDEACAQAFPRRLGPCLVRRAGQEVTAVFAGGLLAGRRVAAGQRGLRTKVERVGVDADRPPRPQGDLAPLQHDAIVSAQRLPCVMRRLAQVGGTGLGVELRPQRIDDLVTGQPVSRPEAQQLDQMGGAKAGPPVGRQFDAVDGGRELAQQAHLEACARIEAVGR